MREVFQGELRRLGDLLADMSDMAARQMRSATRALLENDLILAEQVLSDDDTMDANRDRCGRDAQKLLALQAPVAGDLRTVIAAVHCAERIERMGDLAAHVAESCRRTHPHPVVPESLRPIFAELGDLDAAMAEALRDLISHGDSASFAAMIAEDERVDELHRNLMADITGAEWSSGVPDAVNVALLARFYERFADQAVSVARRLDFALTGSLPA
jgi:phosphate transport system protein